MAERYNDGLPEAEKAGWRLADRVKQIAKGHGMDSRVALQRCVAEYVVWALTEVTALDPVIKGGLLHDQRVRATGDADITTEMQLSAPALYGDVAAAARHLRPHGILITVPEITALDMGGRGHGFRVTIHARLGGTRVCTHLDVGFGPRPEGAARREFRSIFKGPSFVAWAQPLEAQVSDKLAAIITLGSGNTRLKDYADLSRMYRTGLDHAVIARALVATMRERKADTALLLERTPAGLSYEYAEANRQAWRDYVARHDASLEMEFRDIASDVWEWWGEIRETMLDLAERDQLEPRPQVTAPSIETPETNVVSLESYRRMRA